MEGPTFFSVKNRENTLRSMIGIKRSDIYDALIENSTDNSCQARPLRLQT